MSPVNISPIKAGEQVDCEAILRALPQWFGIESSLVQYVADCTRHPTWIARSPCDPRDAQTRACSHHNEPGPICGFITIHQHFDRAAEIHCIAVHPSLHRHGIGRVMIEFVEDHLRGRGLMFLQVKTLGPSRPDPNYELTLRFYESLGFVALEEFATLWPGNPALQLVKSL